MSSPQNEAAAGETVSGTPDQGEARPATMPGPTGPHPDIPGATGRFGVPGQPGGKLPWKTVGDRTVFRRLAPLVLWWIWVAFALFNVIQIVIPDHDYFSLELAAGLLAVTGLAYATGLRPRVIADSDGLEVRNPVRDHIVRWGAVSGVYVGDSVELACARPAPRGDKTIYCWALYSGRRSRLKQQQLGVRSWRVSSRVPAEARELATTPDAAQVIAAEIGRRSAAAREAGLPGATLDSRWAWLPVSTMLVPLAALIALLLAR